MDSVWMCWSRDESAHGCVDMIMVTKGAVQWFQHDCHSAFSAPKPVRSVQFTISGQRLATYPLADASKGLHLPSGERMPP